MTLGLLLAIVFPVPVRAAFVSAAVLTQSVVTERLALIVLSDASSIIRRRRVLPELPPLDLAVDRGSDVSQPHDSRNDTVCNLSLARVVREAQTETAVDDAESDDDAAQPQVTVAPEHAARVLLEHEVVQKTEDWLEEQQNEDDDSDNWVCVVETSDLQRHVHSDAEGGDEHQVGEDLAGGVDPDETAEGGEADQDTADWEEDDKGERGEDAVGDHEFLGVLIVAAEWDVVGVEASEAIEAGCARTRVASIVASVVASVVAAVVSSIVSAVV